MIQEEADESTANQTWPHLEQEETGQDVKLDKEIKGWEQGKVRENVLEVMWNLLEL